MGKFPDPFDKSLSETLITGIAYIQKSVTDPYCIGYFVDNELYWGDNSYMAKAVIQSPENQPAKLAMELYLKEKYKSVSELNKTWKTGFGSWNDFLANRELPDADNRDIREFSEIIADTYFKVVKGTLKKVSPDKLYLGCRFDFHYYPAEDSAINWIVDIAAKYCDVVSFNRYRYFAAELRPGLADKPVMIGEWHMGALDRGMLHFSLRYADDQKNRAEMYEYYLKSCLLNPYIVGAHWFEYVDEPVLGRFDGRIIIQDFLMFAIIHIRKWLKLQEDWEKYVCFKKIKIIYRMNSAIMLFFLISLNLCEDKTQNDSVEKDNLFEVVSLADKPVITKGDPGTEYGPVLNFPVKVINAIIKTSFEAVLTAKTKKGEHIEKKLVVPVNVIPVKD